MENASKALIIAGAILISILLISVGIIIMNAINDPVSSAGDSAASQAIEIFNAKFTAYDGAIKGSTLKGIISTINASNATDSDHTIALTSSNANVTSTATINSNTTYTVEVHYCSGSTTSYTASKVLVGPTTPSTEVGYIYEIEIK